MVKKPVIAVDGECIMCDLRDKVKDLYDKSVLMRDAMAAKQDDIMGERPHTQSPQEDSQPGIVGEVNSYIDIATLAISDTHAFLDTL